MDAYYLENWVDIKGIFKSALLNYSIDDEAKITFQEALETHEFGLYRATCRLLLPEIERTVRQRIHDNDLNLKIASQHELRKLAGTLPIDTVKDLGHLSFHLYRKLNQHIYTNINSKNIERFIIDPVPNRHAAVHGLISYDSHANSMNAIIMTDYIFRLITIFQETNQT